MDPYFTIIIIIIIIIIANTSFGECESNNIRNIPVMRD
jgi:hypothetical protein